jgi:hypothetical protein
MGLCERVNRSVGLIVSTPRELDEAIRDTCVEAMLLVQELYGHDGVVEVERMAAVTAAPARPHGRRRPHLFGPHGGLRTHAG